MVRTIYIDDETRDLEKKIQEKNKDINFSFLYKVALVREVGDVNENDISSLKEKLNQLIEKRAIANKDIDAEIDIIKQKIELRTEANNEKLNQFEKEVRLKEEEAKRKRIERYTDSIMENHSIEDKHKDQIYDLAVEFADNQYLRQQHGADFIKFVLTKGFKIDDKKVVKEAIK